MYRTSNNRAVAKETYSFQTHVHTLLLPTLRTMSAESTTRCSAPLSPQP
jgi:hypothetical protein